MNRYFLSFLILCSMICCRSSPKILWSFQTGAPVYGSPAIAGDRLIVGSSDHFLYALDLLTGKQIWKSDLGERVLSTPLVDATSAYVGAANGHFFSVNLRSGRIQWNFESNGIIDFDSCADDQGIYFGNYNGHFFKLSRDGRKIWVYTAGHYFSSSCDFYQHLVITSCWDTNFYGFDRSSGTAVWKVSSGLFNYGGPALNGDTVYFGTHNMLYRIQAGTGKVLSIEKIAYLDWPLVYDGFLWTNESGLRKRTLDGKQVGYVEFLSGSTFRPVATNGYLIQATNTNSLYGISKDLKILWKFKADDSFWSSGVVRNDVYYTGNRDSHVYALQLPK